MSKFLMFEVVKIQFLVLILIVCVFEEEFGKECVYQIVGDVVVEFYVQYCCVCEKQCDVYFGEGEFGFFIEMCVVENMDDCFGFDVMQCDFVDYFCFVGELEIGGLFICGVDFRIEELLWFSWLFSRIQIQMQGVDYCDFCWQKKSVSSEEGVL